MAQYSANERAAYAKARSEEMHRQIEELGRTWEENPEEVAEFMLFRAKHYKYSQRNSMLIYKQNRGASFCASFQDWKKQGYSVKKGEHGMKIMVYTPYKAIMLGENLTDEWVRYSEATTEQKKQADRGELKIQLIDAYKEGTVFDIAQTTCPLEDYPNYLGLGYNSREHYELYNQIKEYAESIGVTVEENLASVTLRGFYSRAEQKIEISHTLGDTQKVSTILHELSHHLLGHGGDSKLSEHRVEFEADALSIMFETYCGLNTTDARKRHLSEHYKAYTDELKDAKYEYSAEQLFKSVDKAFNENIKSLSDKINERFIMRLSYPEQQFQANMFEPVIYTRLEEAEKRGSMEEYNKNLDLNIQCKRMFEDLLLQAEPNTVNAIELNDATMRTIERFGFERVSTVVAATLLKEEWVMEKNGVDRKEFEWAATKFRYDDIDQNTEKWTLSPRTCAVMKYVAYHLHDIDSQLPAALYMSAQNDFENGKEQSHSAQEQTVGQDQTQIQEGGNIATYDKPEEAVQEQEMEME